MREVFLVALGLGLRSFGGPVAHIGFFHDEYVTRRRWVEERDFGELVAVTSLLPGPSSSQLGIAIGTLRAGKLGGLAAWTGFTVPSAVLMLAFALWLRDRELAEGGWLQGLQLAAAAVVAAALVGMARTFVPDLPRVALAGAAAALVLVWNGSVAQVVVIAAAGLVGVLALRDGAPPALGLRLPVSRGFAAVSFGTFLGLLALLPVLRDVLGGHALALADSFYRTGSLVFGGGHVVLPLLHGAVVEPGWVGEQVFLAGYGAAQALPGPLFSFAAYLGAAETPEPDGLAGGGIALATVFLPSFLLVWAVLPAWGRLRERSGVQAAVRGIGAAVVGLLAAALWDPLLTTAVDDVLSAIVGVALLLALRVLPAWAVVALGAALGAILL